MDEGIDTFSMGNNIYCLLTGLWPFYEWSSYSAIQEKLLQKERTYVDPRWRTKSFAEYKLVEIMEQTWEHDPEKRISIFEVVRFLREAMEENKKQTQRENMDVVPVVRQRQRTTSRVVVRRPPPTLAGVGEEKMDGHAHHHAPPPPRGQEKQEKQTMTTHMKIHYV
jgi:serine/threonine protein kinase